MEILTFTQTEKINERQLSDEILKAAGVWVGKWIHIGDQLSCSVAPQYSPLSSTQKASIDIVVSAHVADPLYGIPSEILFSGGNLPIVWAVLCGADMPNRTVTVERAVRGKTVRLSAKVAYAMVRAYQDGQLKVGDKVLVAFIDNDISKPIVIDKVVL